MYVYLYVYMYIYMYLSIHIYTYVWIYEDIMKTSLRRWEDLLKTLWRLYEDVENLLSLFTQLNYWIEDFWCSFNMGIMDFWWLLRQIFEDGDWSVHPGTFVSSAGNSLAKLGCSWMFPQFPPYGGFLKMGDLQKWWFVMENPNLTWMI